MSSINTENDADESDHDDENDDDEYDDGPRSHTNRVSDLIRLTGKPKTPVNQTAKSISQNPARTGKQGEVVLGKATQLTALKTPRRKIQRTTNSHLVSNSIEVLGSLDDTNRQETPRPGATTTDRCPQDVLSIPDSAGEANDVWVISSDEE